MSEGIILYPHGISLKKDCVRPRITLGSIDTFPINSSVFENTLTIERYTAIQLK